MARRTPSFTPLVALAVALFSGIYLTLMNGHLPTNSISTAINNATTNLEGHNRTGSINDVGASNGVTDFGTNGNNNGGRSEISVYFSPKGGCTEACVHEIESARQTILVQAYSFTSAPIAKALQEAHARGVKVTIVLDKSQRSEQYTEADFVLHAGIPTYIDDKHAIAHNKIMLIDGRTIITGSFNFTSSAEKSNAENMLVMHDMPQLFTAYQENFQHHLAHSVQYVGREEGSEPKTSRFGR